MLHIHCRLGLTKEVVALMNPKRRLHPRHKRSQMFSRGSAACGLGFELLEDRSMLTAYFVNTIADDPLATATDTDGVVSLREAIQAASTNAIFGDATAGDGGGATDTISFDGSLSGQTIVLGGADLAIHDRISITGLGRDNLTISGNQTSRVFSIADGVAADISGLTITAGAASFGAGIYNEGELTLSSSKITGNAAVESGGGIHNGGSLTLLDSVISNNSSTYYYGGAIWNDGVVSITNSQLTGNYAYYYGGAIWSDGAVTITNSAISGNQTADEGGGIWSDGLLEVNYSTFSENSSDSAGGTIWNDGTLNIVHGIFSDNSTDGTGGAISNQAHGKLTVAESTFSGNTSNIWGGAINSFGGFGTTTGTLDITNSIFTANSGSSGGAIWNWFPATISGSTFEQNTARNWGGEIANGSETTTVTDSSFADNHAGFFSGAIDNSFNGTMVIARSTMSGNFAGYEGGAVENYFGTMQITNSTLSGNSTDGDGGGIWNRGALKVTNTTVTGNRADVDGDGSGSGGGVFHDSSTYYPDLFLANSIVAGNFFGGVSGTDIPNDIVGPMNTASSHNLIGDAVTSGGLTDGDQGNIVGIGGAGTIDITSVLDLNLADNGGSTLTHALVSGSPAIDAGDSSLAVDGDGNPLLYDQRGIGFTRTLGSTVDIGAFETLPQFIEVDIDVKPGSENNPINLASHGVLAVAIFTTDDFDAAWVDASTVVFAGASAVQSALEDINGDGDLDLVLHFRLTDTILADAYVQLIEDDLIDGILDSNHQQFEATLTGETLDGVMFQGSDDVDLFLTGRALRELIAGLGS